jgi:hypothetical protein
MLAGSSEDGQFKHISPLWGSKQFVIIGHKYAVPPGLVAITIRYIIMN